jgi:large subunit ribosomal protein L25
MVRKKISTQSRKNTHNAKKLIRDGFLPAVAYDQDTNSYNIKLDYGEAIKLARSATPSTLYDLHIEEKGTQTALIKEIQKNIRTGTIHHISFMILDPDNKVDISVDVVPKGESKAVRNNLGVLIFVHDHLELRGYPKDIPESLKADISSLEDIGDKIGVDKIKIPDNLEFVREDDKNLTIATIRPFQKVQEVVVEEEETEEEGVEVGEILVDEDGEVIEPAEGEDVEGAETPEGAPEGEGDQQQKPPDYM